MKILLSLLLEIFLRKSRPPLLPQQVTTLGQWGIKPVTPTLFIFILAEFKGTKKPWGMKIPIFVV